jgi:hypothetical protein
MGQHGVLVKAFSHRGVRYMTVVPIATGITELVPVVIDGEIVGMPISTELGARGTPLMANCT